MPNQSFEQIYQSLNPAQKKAVDTIDGPVMVMAGPGTGKTQVLAARIANILLKTDTNPSQILALTFTESAATNMQQRIVTMIGPTGYQVKINTFHGFCHQIMLRYPEYFPIVGASQPLTELERYQLFTDLIKKLPLKVLRPINDPLHYLKGVIKAISDLKREGVNLANYEQMIHAEFGQVDSTATKLQRLKFERDRDKNQELLLLYRSYQESLDKSGKFDFDDMVSMVVTGFEQNPLLLLEQQEELLYFLIDEYQDANTAQNKVVELLAAYWQEKANVFVVGDPAQSIFRFQGASLENVHHFLQRYRDCQLISLDVGYRCAQPIYNAAHWLIGQNKEATKEGLKFSFVSDTPIQLAEKKDQQQLSAPSPLQLFKAPSRMVELMFVSDQVKKLIESGVDPSQIAVLYRKNQESFELMEVFDRAGIRYEVAGGGNVLQTESARQLFILLRVILELRSSHEAEDLFEVLTYDWMGLDRLSVYKLARRAGAARTSLVQLIENHPARKSASGANSTPALSAEIRLTPLEMEAINRVYQDLIKFGLDDWQLAFPEWFAKLIKEVGYLDWLMQQPNRVELIINLNAIFQELKSMSRWQVDFKLENFLQAIELMQAHHLSLTAEDLNIERGAVQLSTVHKAKGREWGYVFVVGLNDRVWGNTRHIEKIRLPESMLQHTQVSKLERNDEERRLFYVALTRAKLQSVLSFPTTTVVHQQTKNLIESQFLSELMAGEADQGNYEIVLLDAADLLDQATQRLTTLFEPASQLSLTAKEQRFIKHLTEQFSLSVSSLNKYLNSPQEFLTDVLLRLPKAKEAPMAFGSAVHAMLEWVNKQIIVEQIPDEDQALAIFERALQNEVLTTPEFERRLEFGREILTRYLRQQFTGDHLLAVEQKFGYGELATYLDDIHLTGKIDRVDWLDKQKRQVKVIDYKTGRPRSLNEIEGKSGTQHLSERELALPEGIRGPYKRQLVFYKLLTQLAPGFPYQAVRGVLEFIEPRKSSGKFVSRDLPLLDDDVEHLKQLIRQVMKEIRQLDFLSFT